MMDARPDRLVRNSKRIGVFTLIVFAVMVAGCSNPDREILDRLNAAEKERFLRGRSVAGPCWVCHDLAGIVQKVGPPLLGVYGRRSGLAPGYEGSAAMIGATIVWDDRSIATFLMNPADFVPGNRMVSPGVQNRAALGDLLFYLKHVTRPGARTAEGSNEKARTEG